MTWSTRKIEQRVGEYAVNTRTTTEHFSLDGRFVIRRSGGMRYCRANGFHGQRSNRWVWSGYELRDVISGWARRYSTVARCKQHAARTTGIGPLDPHAVAIEAGFKNGARVERVDGCNAAYEGRVVAQIQRTIVKVAWSLPSRPDVVVGHETLWTKDLQEVRG